MVIVLDSVSLNHLLRMPRKKRERFTEAIGTALDAQIKNKVLKLAVDPSRGLIDEWGRTVGQEYVNALVERWESMKGIIVVDRIGAITTSQKKTLLQLGFNDSGDRLIVKIALGTADKLIVSDDSDFWDPKKKKNYGKASAPVISFLREDLAITVVQLGVFMTRLTAPKEA